MRILGVLQRIGLAYGMAAFLCVMLSRQVLAITAGFLLAGYWTVLHRAAEQIPTHWSLMLYGQVDLMLLGAGHLWMGKGIPFDPEGCWSTLPAVVSCYHRISDRQFDNGAQI
ncbi:MAG: hypothetical protein IPL27_27905 [Lewinellaceae bacterium]|nr:hypothetical protein [Lewinellaceae bacterium]